MKSDCNRRRDWYNKIYHYYILKQGLGVLCNSFLV